MFGSQSAWYYQRLAGIQLVDGTRGFSNIRFDPQVCRSEVSPEASDGGRSAMSWLCTSRVSLPMTPLLTFALHRSGLRTSPFATS